MVSFLGLSDNICAFIICAVAGINFLNACIVTRYARRKGIAATDCGAALVFFVALCTGAHVLVYSCPPAVAHPSLPPPAPSRYAFMVNILLRL
jgi:hypothetical protein